ncbi:MAG TPA: hypothetical protein VGF65_06530 [Mycobacterium sp.]
MRAKKVVIPMDNQPVTVPTFLVQRVRCATCIYRRDTPLDIRKLEADVADEYGGFRGLADLPSFGRCVLPGLLGPPQG